MNKTFIFVAKKYLNKIMPYNPNLHHRRSIRLKGYDYSQAGLYFVTICCQDKICRFGEIETGEMILNDFGKIAYDEWEKLSERYSNVLFGCIPNYAESYSWHYCIG
jgi:hypothetical protein